MEAYRDQYATIFNKGQNVVVMGISVDPDTTLANWARQSGFPILFVSDTSTTISRAYKTFNEQSKLDRRDVYVIGPDGKISFKMAFRPLVQTDYDTLGVEVGKLIPRKEGGP